MKNINVSLKMIICFSIMIIMSLCICVSGIVGMQKLSNETSAMYNEIVVATEYIGLIRENFQEQRVLIQELALMSVDPAEAQTLITAVNTNKLEMRDYLAGYSNDLLNGEDIFNEQILSAENSVPFEQFATLYNDYFEVELTRLVRYADNMSHAEVEAFITSPEAEEMKTAMNAGLMFYSDLAEEVIAEAEALYVTLRTIIIVATAVTFIVSAFFAIYLPVTIARPLRHMVQVADAVAVGNMEMEVGYEDRHDEVGKLASAFERMKSEINKQIATVEALSQADLTVKPVLRSEHDTLGIALSKLTDSLDRIISDVTTASDNVALESRDVAGQSQELAQGTTEQAASVEELSSAFFEISLNTKESANLAGKAAEVTDDVRRMAMEGETLMAQMTQAVRDADSASKNIEKIIKAIEEISFQTNILALNAAVEAAHAGQNGSGFAVVASEVRSLASKSAASSKETGVLIADTLEKVQLGAEIAAQTSVSFKRIVEGIMESTKLVTDIAKSAEEQAIAIDQINTGISQVAQVIHLNSGAAEKCASAAEKMSRQAKVLEETVGMFKTKNDVRIAAAEPGEAPFPVQEEPPMKIDLSPSIPTEGFGKY